MLVSAIIPVFNREHLLERAARSVVTQALPPGWQLELIMVDDGSTDGTAGVAAQIATGDDRARIVSVPHCGMAGAVRNWGVREARGSLLAFLDSDDMWLPGKLASQIPLHSHEVLFSHTRERWVDQGREISQNSRRFRRWRRDGEIFPDALQRCIVGPSTVVMDRRLWNATGGFREDLEIAEDYEYWLRVTAVTPVAYLAVEFTEKHAGHPGQLSRKYDHIEIFRLHGLRDLVTSRWFARHTSEGYQELAETELARKAAIYARGCRRRGRTEEALMWEKYAASF